jgi:hypothetical protein
MARSGQRRIGGPGRSLRWADLEPTMQSHFSREGRAPTAPKFRLGRAGPGERSPTHWRGSSCGLTAQMARPFAVWVFGVAGEGDQEMFCEAESRATTGATSGVRVGKSLRPLMPRVPLDSRSSGHHLPTSPGMHRADLAIASPPAGRSQERIQSSFPGAWIRITGGARPRSRLPVGPRAALADRFEDRVGRIDPRATEFGSRPPIRGVIRLWHGISHPMRQRPATPS